MAFLKIDLEENAKAISQIVLDELLYKGRTLRQWADAISKPKTNADKIRAMTDEELAEIIPARVDCSECPARIGDYRACVENCKERWLDWLRQEADT